jgi:hypothetical protein
VIFPVSGWTTRLSVIMGEFSRSTSPTKASVSVSRMGIGSLLGMLEGIAYPQGRETFGIRWWAPGIAVVATLAGSVD